jgi:hypothetical protein
MPNSDEVTISRERYNELLRQEAFLVALESAGVDNWCGYGEAQEMCDDLSAAMDDDEV